ncbi:MAG: spore coat associated protein CotJA [Oscillospiraceae bacterium]|nr:spore coat associated protein CotJA [Oscillospiraceae bacterium]
MISAETARGPDRPSLAMAYVMPQRQITQVYKTDAALKRGTLFPDLDKPFSGKGGRLNG